MTDVVVSFDKTSLKKKAAKFAGKVHKTTDCTSAQLPIRNEWGELVNCDKFYDTWITCSNCKHDCLISIPSSVRKISFLKKNKTLCSICKCRLG